MDVEVVGGRTKLAQRELLTFGTAGVNAVFRDVNNIVADVKADDCVVNAVVGADARDHHVVSTRTQIESLELFLHRGLIKTVVRIFFDDNLVRIGLEFVDECDCGAAFDQRIALAEESKLGSVFGADRLNVNDFSAGLAKAIQQSADVLDDRRKNHSRSVGPL